MLKTKVRNFSRFVDKKDDAFFKKMTDWWNPKGKLYTLHYLNDLRMEFFTKHCQKQGSLLDVGCGGGLFSEVEL